MLKLKGTSKLRKLILHPYLNSELSVQVLSGTELRGKLFAGVRRSCPVCSDDTELVLFMTQDSETRLAALLREITPFWNRSHTGIAEFDSVTRARTFGDAVEEKFQWRRMQGFRTRSEVKERLRSLGLKPAIMDRVFPPQPNS
jgi:hypothetical protein